ncbi:MAG: hypothetical protein JWO56_162, partial [Acidobacteria bacterium]|nr:hypothetical protein [Acidobacteriota bacterium]
MDIHDIRPGRRWESDIRTAIGEASYFIIFLSKSTVTRRGYFQKEIRLALDVLNDLAVGTFLISARLEDCEVPEPLNQLQYVDLFEPDGWEVLLRTLGKPRSSAEVLETVKHSVVAQERRERQRRHVFVAMPFSKEMEDIFYYGIQRAVDANDLACERVDQDIFTGDVLIRMKERIESAAAVIADLTGSNPNVYLELGFAWGKSIPTILLAQDVSDLRFDVRGQRCVQYTSIRMLEEKLT